MPVSYKDIRNERQWKASTGLSKEDFFSLCAAFKKAYELLHEVSLEQGALNMNKEVVLSSYEDCLYFILFQLKTGQTYDCLGLLFGMDAPLAYRLASGERALPRRSFSSVKEFENYLKADKEIIADVT